MCNKTQESQSSVYIPIGAVRKVRGCAKLRAYFTIDAAFALLLAVFAYSSFAHLASSAGGRASAQSHEISSSLAALRFSSFVLEQAGAGGGFGAGSYVSANEIDIGKLGTLDLGGLLARTGRDYAKISVRNGAGEVFLKETGEANEEVFCAKRLAILSGEIVKLEACLS